MASTGEEIASAVDMTLKAEGSWQDVYLGYGVRELEEHRSWPRIVWVPIGGPVEQTKHPGGRARATGVRAMHLRSAQVQYDVFIHYDSYENTENLWKAFVASCVMELRGSVEHGNHEWITETTAHDWSVEGHMIRQRLSVGTPIHDTDLTTKAVKYQSHTGTFQYGAGEEDVC